MAVKPLTDDEHLLWRNLMALVATLRPALSDDLQRSSGLTATEYAVLMHLSEAPKRTLRMADLAERTNLSSSRISRVVDGMSRAGLVERRAGTDDARTTYSTLTKSGFATLRKAWPHHIESVRRLSFDHLTPEEVRLVGPILERLAEAGKPYKPAKGQPD